MKKKAPFIEWEDDFCGSKSEKSKERKGSLETEEHHLVLGLRSES